MIVLFADTDEDIDLKIAKKYGYHLISMPYTINDKIVYPYEDWKEFDEHEFYQSLRDGTLPTTSSISEEKYINYFEPHFKKGDDVFYIHFSRTMSTSFNAMDRAVAKLKEKYPERKFYELDTNGISILALNILEEIGDMFKGGKSPEEILDWAKKEVSKFAVYFFSDDLKFFKHSGRISNLTGTMGTLLGVRPLIYIGDDGIMTNIGKEKGRMRAVEALVNKVKELGDDIKNHRIIVASCDNKELRDFLKNRLIEEFGNDLWIEEVAINPTVGIHCGPDTVGVSFHAKHR